MTLNVSGDLLWHSPLWEVAEMDAQDTVSYTHLTLPTILLV